MKYRWNLINVKIKNIFHLEAILPYDFWPAAKKKLTWSKNVTIGCLKNGVLSNRFGAVVAEDFCIDFACWQPVVHANHFLQFRHP